MALKKDILPHFISTSHLYSCRLAELRQLVDYKKMILSKRDTTVTVPASHT
jgi:hypothetical protein